VSKLELPRFGMGTACLGNLYVPISDEVAVATVAAALAAGIRYFDTAPFYGFGLAERRLGTALEAHDPEGRAIVSTKVGRLLEPVDNPVREQHGFVDGDPFAPVFDYSYDAVLRSHEESLKRLRRDRVEILLAHDLGALTHGSEAERHMRAFLDGGYRAMADLKSGGAIDAIGIGVNETAVIEYLLERVDLDVVLIAGRYTLLDQRAAEWLLPMCAARGVKVIVGGPYNSGILARSGIARAEARYDYLPAPAKVVARAEAIEQVCDRFCVPLPAAALQFPSRHPAVDCVIAGFGGEREVGEAVERLATPIAEELWQALEEQGLVRSGAGTVRA
jgi:D-threo-aldose 1-dehydrogenase